MASFDMEIAGLTYHIVCVYDFAEKYCARYCIQDCGEHTITVTQADIDREREICEREGTLCNVPNPFLETVCLLGKLADEIISDNRVLMHGSAIAVNGKGYIFTAASGTGKSTHTALLRQLHGKNAVMVNDDKPILHIAEDKIYVCGNPWNGKHNLGSNIIVPLEGIYFLRQSKENVLDTLVPGHAVSRLIAQCHRPSDPEKMLRSFDLFDQILTRVPLYDFGCNMDISAAELSSSVMK